MSSVIAVTEELEPRRSSEKEKPQKTVCVTILRGHGILRYGSGSHLDCHRKLHKDDYAIIQPGVSFVVENDSRSQRLLFSKRNRVHKK